jgi:hypothetical protein
MNPRTIRWLFGCLLLACLVPVQSGAQQNASSQSETDLVAQIKALREALLETQNQLAAQQMEIETLKAQQRSTPGSVAIESAPGRNTESAGSSSSAQPEPAASASDSVIWPQPLTQQPSGSSSDKAPVGSFRVGDAVLQFGGFADLENVYRTTNTQNNIATVFAGIPFNNTAQGTVSEFRTTAQFSRLTVRVTDGFDGNTATGYVEGDFSGNNAANVYQDTSNLTSRLRLYFGMFQRGNWEVVGGQVWSWLTPNREGLGPIPSDLAITYNEDQNLGVGVPYSREAGLRGAYYFSKHWALGAGINATDQFIGGFVALPAAFASVATQFDNNAQIGTPNFFPDLHAKTAYDNAFLGRHFHGELVGFFTGAHARAQPAGETFFRSRNVYGGGGSIAANYELSPHKLVLLADAFWSDGGAHYLDATGPQLVVRPNPAGTDFRLSMVHAGAGSTGFEWRASPKEAFALYYAGDYYSRDFFPDTTNTAHPLTIIGYGGPGSPNTNNRTIQQVTFDWLRTFWKSDDHGALQYYTQYSYLTRTPWFVAPGAPKDAHLSMVYAGIRYVLPSTAGTLQHVPYPN